MIYENVEGKDSLSYKGGESFLEEEWLLWYWNKKEVNQVR